MRLRILQLVNYMYPHIGGIEQIARDVSGVLKKSGVEQKIICFNDKSETVRDYVDGVEVIRCGCLAKVLSQSVSLVLPEVLSKAMKDFRPDIVIFHYPNPYVAAFLLLYENDPFKLYVFWHLDITKQKYARLFFRKQNLRLIERADKVVAATEIYLAHSDYADPIRGKKYILPYVVDPSKQIMGNVEKQKAEEIREEYRNKTLCFGFGRHVEYKGFRYLIEASEKLDDSFVIFIGGTGKLTEKLKKQAVKDRKVIFLGQLSDSVRRAYLHACDIFCFPSVTKNEAFGLALAEAMCIGKPAVTFHIPGSGVNYLNIDGKTGIECPNADSDAFAEAIKKLAEDPNLRRTYGEAAKERIEKYFSKELFEKGLLGLIDENGIC